jgi:hypothetical protein
MDAQPCHHQKYSRRTMQPRQKTSYLSPLWRSKSYLIFSISLSESQFFVVCV